MTLLRLNNITPAPSFHSIVNRFFNEPFGSVYREIGDDETPNYWNPVVDIYDNENSIVVHADLPGVEKDKLSIDLDGRVLSIKGERGYEKEVEDKSFYRKERAFGTFKRAFTLPEYVDAETINAEFKNGVLKIEIKKPEEKKPKEITIN